MSGQSVVSSGTISKPQFWVISALNWAPPLPSRLHAWLPGKSGVSPSCLQHLREKLGDRLTDDETPVVIPTSPSLASPTCKCCPRREWNALADARQAPSVECAHMFTGFAEGTETSGEGVQTTTCTETSTPPGNDRSTALRDDTVVLVVVSMADGQQSITGPAGGKTTQL